MAQSQSRRRRRPNGQAGGRIEGAGERSQLGRLRDVYAAVDLGTNNCRMLVAKPELGGFRVVDSFSRITRLGEGLSSHGCLAASAMDRTIDALQCCADKMKKRGVTASRHVATEACRRAANFQEFLDRAVVEAGLSLEVISAEEEAELALKGCASLLDRQVPYALIFDIGGGSTEVLFVHLLNGGMNILGCISLPLGVVTVAEDCGGGDLCARTYEEVTQRVMRMLEPFEYRHGVAPRIASGEVQMIGTSGTVTTLGGLHLRLPRYDRTVVDGLNIGFETLMDHSHSLCRMSLTERAAEPCIGWQRADLVLGGCAILEAICRIWPVGRLTVADRGLREGMLMDLMKAAGDTEAAVMQVS